MLTSTPNRNSRRGRLPRVVAVLVALALFGIFYVASPVAAGSNRTFVTHNCHGVKMKPWKILFACGDGNYYADHLQWGKWKTYRAHGHGHIHYNDCDPSCAEGEFHEVDGKIRMRHRKFCENVGKFVFVRVRIAYEHPVNGHWREHFRMDCPI